MSIKILFKKNIYIYKEMEVQKQTSTFTSNDFQQQCKTIQCEIEQPFQQMML